MSFVDDGWEADFPLVMHFVDIGNLYSMPWKMLQKHPDYDAAKKHEDRTAALRLVASYLDKSENRSQIQWLKNNYPGAIIVPVRALEAGGNNRLPVALGEYLAFKTDFEIDTGIVQSNTVHRTGSDAWHRLAFRPEFSGPVKQGGKYILVDDVFSNGGTFSELRHHIEKNGGKVLQTASLALGGHGSYIAMAPETRKKLLDKYSDKKLQLFMSEEKLYDGNYKCLTNREALAICSAASLDTARNCIHEARRIGNTQIYAGLVDEREEKLKHIRSDRKPITRSIER
ncbi:MAG: hypothetical protein Ta2A_07850 [Treponemataceae bacterium]|nr:MAG: hypothetical protein Ta2A_07850 [Treponemataceae bacterium]